MGSVAMSAWECDINVHVLSTNNVHHGSHEGWSKLGAVWSALHSDGHGGPAVW